MSASEAAESPLAPPPPELVEIGVYPSYAAGAERGLVVLALGESYWLEEAPGGFSLRIEPDAAARVHEQLAKFERESLRWPPPVFAPPLPAHPGGFGDALGWIALLCVGFWIQGRWPHATAAGLLDATRVFAHGEWWRIATALGLHADPRHFLANLFGGALVVAAVTATLGRGRGWLALAAAALAGNFCAVALRASDAYRSLGASTAIFAGLGLLTGRALRLALRTRGAARWRALFVPLGAGLTVFALHGAGGGNVDVLAHATGFGCGLVLGAVAGAPRFTPARS